jgi:hypothetical protein
MVSKVDIFCSLFCLLSPDGRQGDTERVVTRWWHLVACMKALNILHWVMLALLHHRTAIAIKIAYGGGAFVRCSHSFLHGTIVAKNHVMVHLN